MFTIHVNMFVGCGAVYGFDELFRLIVTRRVRTGRDLELVSAAIRAVGRIRHFVAVAST